MVPFDRPHKFLFVFRYNCDPILYRSLIKRDTGRKSIIIITNFHGIHIYSRDVRGWLSTFPFPPIPIYSITILSHPHSQVFDLFPLSWDSRVGYSHSLPFPFRVSDRVRVSLGMWNNPKFTRPSIALIRIMSSVYMQIWNRKVKSLPMPIAFRFVT